MTDYYVGSGGNNSNSGLSWALRRLTLTSIETLVAAGDRVFVAPGVYRETLTAGVSGGSTYTTGTVSVTNGSAVVTGSGTSWLANAFANGQFRVTSLASGSDGVGNGTSTFTSAAGNFQAGHVGLVIQIAGQGAYTITARASATSITLSGTPGSASGLSYSIMTPATLEIQSVDSNTQITLKQAWCYPSFTGLAYITYKDIKYIADVTGVNTDGVGGIVRITGGDNDQTATRASCLIASFNYRTFRGFALDFTTSSIINGTGNDVIIEDCFVHDTVSNAISISGSTQLRWTVRRCVLESTVSPIVVFSHTIAVDNANHVLENCIVTGGTARGVQSDRVGGITLRNNTFYGNVTAIRVVTAISVGQALVVNNCIIASNSIGVQATTTAEFVEDYNNFFANGTARTTVSAGSHSQIYPTLFQPQLLLNGSIFTLIAFMLSSYSQLGSIAGLNQPVEDLYGIVRAAPSSWGAVQYSATRRPSDAGSSRNRRGGYQ